MAHRHRASDERGPWRYTRAVAEHPDHENPAAHGGVEYIDVCSCGAERRRLVNNGHVERGPWRVPSDPRRIDRVLHRPIEA